MAEEQKTPGVLYAAECRDASIYCGFKRVISSRDAKIYSKRRVKTLEVNLSSNASYANHVVPALKGKEGITLVSELFGNPEDIQWGEKRKSEIEEYEREKDDYLITIANKKHPIRWTSGRGLVIVDGYALLNIRANYAETDPGKLSDLGGYGEKNDLYDPGYCAHREIAEEPAILTIDRTLFFPRFSKEQNRGVDFEGIITKACRTTGLEFSEARPILGCERKDLSENFRVIIREDNILKLEEKLQFLYDPSANCGIDVMATVEYETGLDPTRELRVGFAEYYPIPGGVKVLGRENNMVFVNIYELLGQFDKGTRAKDVSAHLRNAYTGVFEGTTINPTNINSSLRQQLETMKRRDYKFGR